MPLVPCLWFAMCDRNAVGTLPHPLGPIPACERCANQVGMLDQLDYYPTKPDN